MPHPLNPSTISSSTTGSTGTAITLAQSGAFRFGTILLILSFAALYAFTLDTGLQPYELHGGDLITHQYAQVQARPSNAPGYPLYTMGGWLWFHGWRTLIALFGQSHPNPMPILSSYSTVWALLALWLLYAIVGHLLGKSRQPRLDTLFCLLITAFFGVTYFFWYYATTTEQYSSAVAQTLAIFYLYLHWENEPSKRSRLYWLALLCGLSLAHMLTVAFIVPPLVIAVLWRDPSLLRSPRAIFFCIASAALPLFSYLYVFLRGALHPEWWGNGDWATPQEWFWAFVSTAQGRDELGWAFETGRTFFGNGFPELIWQELSLPLLMLGLVGISQLPRRQAFVLYGTLLIYAIFCWLYRFGNWFQVILPAYPLILLGIIPLYHLWQTRFNKSARFGRLLFLVALTIATLWRINASLPAADSRHRTEDTALYHAAILLDQPLPSNSQLFAAVDDALALSYLTEIWEVRPDLHLVSSREANESLSNGGRIISTTDATNALLDELSVPTLLDSISADWIELSPAANTTTLPPIESSILYSVIPELHLASASATPSPMGTPFKSPAPPGIDVLLTWHVTTGKWPENVAISVRPTLQGMPILDLQSGQPIQQDRPRPVYGLWQDRPNSPSTTNPVVVHDAYRLLLPTPVPDGVDGILVILYTQNANGFTNLAEISLPLTRILEN